jgi:hypothetical protein
MATLKPVRMAITATTAWTKVKTTRTSPLSRIRHELSRLPRAFPLLALARSSRQRPRLPQPHLSISTRLKRGLQLKAREVFLVFLLLLRG